MKSAIVPAQVISVEDKISTSLTIKQLIIFIISASVEFCFFVTIPKSLKFNIYKLLFIFLTSMCLFSLGIRVKERLIFNWLIIIFNYCKRPRFYLYDKNSIYLRENISKVELNSIVADKKINKSVYINKEQIIPENQGWFNGKGFKVYANQIQK